MLRAVYYAATLIVGAGFTAAALLFQQVLRTPRALQLLAEANVPILASGLTIVPPLVVAITRNVTDVIAVRVCLLCCACLHAVVVVPTSCSFASE